MTHSLLMRHYGEEAGVYPCLKLQSQSVRSNLILYTYSERRPSGASDSETTSRRPHFDDANLNKTIRLDSLPTTKVRSNLILHVQSDGVAPEMFGEQLRRQFFLDGHCTNKTTSSSFLRRFANSSNMIVVASVPYGRYILDIWL